MIYGDKLEIDGSVGEGGGQVLRTALGMSVLFDTMIVIKKIRFNRTPPGLKPQHLATLKALASISGAEVEGARLGSSSVTFSPAKIAGGSYYFDIKTAGSVTLLLQALMLPLAFAPERSTITVRGGTDVLWSPTVDYFKNVTLRALRKIGFKSELEIKRRGYYPKGGGKVVMTLMPWEERELLHKIKIEKPTKVYIISSCAGLPDSVARRQAEAASQELKKFEMHDVEVDIDTNSVGMGSAITIWGDAGDMPIGFSALGKKGHRAEDVGREAAKGFCGTVRLSACDVHLLDQIVPFLCLLDSRSVLPVSHLTGHLSTNLEIIGKFVDFYWFCKNNYLEIVPRHGK
ncbi:MAG: RNA 3'-terminal phosphate cyclase [Candidatus Methanofastidiosia archaeon]